ncbi:MAG: GDP-L-fucose synthase [Nitrospirae bacterium]|nr:GDP-L-fucose synthase [Nitrospirota bacterium]
MNKDSLIFVAGGSGMVGSAIIRRLLTEGFTNLVSTYSKNKPEEKYSEKVSFLNIDLTRQAEVENLFKERKPEYVFVAAAKVGGIYANNTYPADFIYSNLAIQNNVIHSAYMTGTKKLLFLGSSCIYPKNCPQPMKEEHLLSGYLEPTNEPYAIAKIAGIRMCQSYNRQHGTNFISAMPTNLYGIGDNFDLQNSHVLPALIRKFHEAKANRKPHVEIWGTGTPRREFLYVDDLADACLFLMQNYNESQIVNIGTGKEITIKELALLVKNIVGYEGELKFDTSKPDGMMRKTLDVSKMTSLGWTAKTGFRDGIKKAYEWFCAKQG